MPSLRSLFANLFGSRSQLTEIEQLVLDCVRNRLTPHLQRLFDGQMQAVNKVQRLPDGVEVDFYRMQNGRPAFDERLAFPNKTQELSVAVVLIEIPALHKRLTAKVWCVNGFIFSIEFDGSANYFEETAAMEPRPTFIVTCDLVADLEKNS